jgi:hypothetical protein
MRGATVRGSTKKNNVFEVVCSCLGRLARFLSHLKDMPLPKYHCDYCDKSFPDTIGMRRKHLESKHHQMMKKLHYDSFRGSTTRTCHTSVAFAGFLWFFFFFFLMVFCLLSNSQRRIPVCHCIVTHLTFDVWCKDPQEILAEEGGKPACPSFFQKGSCTNGLDCPLSHAPIYYPFQSSLFFSFFLLSFQVAGVQPF